MTAQALLAELRALGVELEPVAPDRLRIRPASIVPPDLRAHLTKRKAEVLALLAAPERAPGPRYAHPWPDSLPGLGPRRVGPFDLCSACRAACSWARFGRTVLCLGCALAREGGGR